MSIHMELKYVTPESVGISSKSIISFLDLIKNKGLELHGFMLLRYGEVCIKGYWEPYREDLLHPVHSFGKSVTCIAIGFAIQEGILSLEDKISDFFPEIIVNSSEECYIGKATIKDLLMMASGHETEPSMEGSDWINNFFNHPAKYQPGTMFQYNTAGTNLLCAILKRKTGMDLSCFLKDRLFMPLEIKNYYIDKAEDQTEKGGSGFKFTMGDMAKIMLFIMQKGKVNNKQLLNKEWFDQATVKQINTDNSIFKNASTDNRKGYGYQFWMCSPDNSYRAAGMYGQFGVVVPDRDLLLVTTAAVNVTQELLKIFWDEILSTMVDRPIEKSYKEQTILQNIIDNLTLYPYPVKEAIQHENLYLPFLNNTYYGNDKTRIGINTLDALTPDMGLDASCNVLLTKEKDLPIFSIKYIQKTNYMELVVHAFLGKEVIPIGMNGSYIECIAFKKRIAATGFLSSSNVLEVELRAVEGLKGKRYTFIFEDKGVWILSEDTFPFTPGRMIFMSKSKDGIIDNTKKQ